MMLHKAQRTIATVCCKLPFQCKFLAFAVIVTVFSSARENRTNLYQSPNIIYYTKYKLDTRKESDNTNGNRLVAVNRFPPRFHKIMVSRNSFDDADMLGRVTVKGRGWMDG